MDKNVPDGWQVVNFGDVVKQVKDKFPNRDEWTFDKFVSGGHIDSEQIRVTKFSQILGNEEKIGSAFHMRFQHGHVLYVSRRAYLRKGGMVDFEGICSNTTFILQADESRLLQSLVPFIIQTEDFVKHTTDNSHGSTNPFLNWKDIAKYRLLLPPLEEQKKISEVLWSIEENAEKNEELINTTEILKKRLLNELLTKGIGHKKFKKSELGDIPEKWSVGKINDLAQIIMGQSPKGETYNTVGEGKPLINGPAEFNEYYPSTLKWTSKPTKMCEVGDILFCVRGNTVGRVNFADQEYCIGRGIAAIRGKTNKGITSYIHLVLDYNKNQIYRIANGSGSTFPNINSSQLKNWPCIIPPVEEQKQIVTIFKSLDHSAKSYSDNIENLSSISKKIINDYLSGKLIISKEVL